MASYFWMCNALLVPRLQSFFNDFPMTGTRLEDSIWTSKQTPEP
jgi:hypothetical protein